MPLLIKALLILAFTVGAMLASPLTLAVGVWLNDAGLPFLLLTAIAISAALAVRSLAVSRTSR